MNPAKGLLKLLTFVGIAASLLTFGTISAEARSHHRHHAHASHTHAHRHHHFSSHHVRHRHVSRRHHFSRRHVHGRRFSSANAMMASYPDAGSYAFDGGRSRSSNDPVALAKRYIGSNPTGRRSLWCADFANLVLKKDNRVGTGSRLARSFLSLPRTRPRYGAIAVMGRRGGGHVGFVTGFDQRGNPIIISGNSRGHRVSVSVYDRHRILKYVAAV
jgi:uncharacterized protein (TIGR02594 family)